MYTKLKPQIPSKHKFMEALFTPKYNARNMILAILLGFALATMTLFIVYGKYAIEIINGLFIGDFLDKPTVGYLISKMTIFAFGALAVGVCLRAGLLNIGVSGQATFAGWLAFTTLKTANDPTKEANILFVGLVMCILGGMIFGMIPGILKSLFKVNTVVSTIMLNWIATYIVMSTRTAKSGAEIMGLGNEEDGLIHIVDSTNIWTMVGIGLGLLAFVVTAMYIIQYKTSFGFKTRISGLSEEAATYSGYKTKTNITLIFMISGALSGLMGYSMFFLSDNAIPAVENNIQEGFTAIAIALVAMSNPIAIVPSAFLFSLLYGPVGGISLGGLDSNVVLIFSGFITYFIAAVGLWMYIRPIEWIRKISGNKHKPHLDSVKFIESKQPLNSKKGGKK